MKKLYIFVPTNKVYVMKEYYSTVHEIIKTGHWITDSVSKELKSFGIYEPQYNVLRILKESQGHPISVNAILDQMVQRSSNVTRIVDKLEQKELVVRTLSAEDRRKMDIEITNKGIELLEELDEKVKAFHLPMSKNLDKKELAQLKKLMLKMTQNK